MKNDIFILSKEYVLSQLFYDRERGEFRWVVPKRGIKPFSIAGHTNDQGYSIICLDSKKHRAHRLVWLCETGEFPQEEIDHIDGDRSNNHISNLRTVSRAENKRNIGKPINNKSGYQNVLWYPPLNKWHVQISKNGKRIHIGYYFTLNEAVDARDAALAKYGFHKNHGKKNSWVRSQLEEQQ